MIKPTKGKAFIYGELVCPNNIKLWEKVGYLVEIPYAYLELTVKENLEIFFKLRGLKRKTIIEEIIYMLKLSPYKNVKARYLSQGNLQRLGITKALLHDPEVLIIDEPANGLDPAGIVEIRELFKNLSKNFGKTIFISSHILAEISKIADRIGIIHEGKLIKELTIEDLEKERKRRLVVNTKDNKYVYELLIINGFKVSVNRDGFLEIEDPEILREPEKLSKFLVFNGKPPTMLKIEEEDLESYFLRIVRERRRE